MNNPDPIACAGISARFRTVLYMVSGLLVALAGCADPFGSAGTGALLSQVAAGAQHACGLDSQGKAYCWGRGRQGQLGDGGSSERAVPVSVRGDQRFSQLSAGDYHTCGITATGVPYCWGAEGRDIAAGQLGTGSVSDGSREPVRVSGSARFTAISAGLAHTCAMDDNGRAYCWGHNRDGQLGDGSRTSRASPVAVAGGVRFARLDAGRKHTCGVTADGVAHCWGANLTGQLGHPSLESCELAVPCSLTPSTVDSPVRFSNITAGSDHTCGLSATGEAFCWGQNGGGALGTGDTISAPIPVRVATELRFVSLDAGSGHTCGVTTAGAAYCWGNKDLGQLGTRAAAAGCGEGRDYCSAIPLLVDGTSAWTHVSAGTHFTCGASADQTVHCWGWNRESQLGVSPGSVGTCRGSDRTPCSLVPVRVSGQKR